MFLLYVVGLPVMALVGVTAVHKRAVVQKKHVMKLKGHKTWGMFYSSFRQDAWWWEITVAIRKIIIALIAVFGRSMGEMQVHFMALIMVIIIVMTMLYQPFGDRKKMHLLEMSTLIMTFITLWSGSVFNAYPKCLNKHGQSLWWCNLISLVVGVGNIMTVLFIACFFSYTKFVKEQKVLHDKKELDDLDQYHLDLNRRKVCAAIKDIPAVATTANDREDDDVPPPPPNEERLTSIEMSTLGFKNPMRTSSMKRDSNSIERRTSMLSSTDEIVT